MKKIIMILVLALMFTTITTLNATFAYSSTGWTASTGLSTMRGVAIGTHTIPGGYAFWCLDYPTVCYVINGPDLNIYDNLDSSEEDDEGVYIEVLEN